MTKMRHLFRLGLLGALLAATCSRAADAQWIRLKSSNFELVTSAGEKKGREAILYFERVQNVFAQILKSGDTTPLPVRIVAFRSKKEYEPYQLGEVSSAYYLGSSERDYIVMSGIGVESYPTALHEFTHLLVRHGDIKVPVCLNEGLAEFYSTLKPQGKKVMVGELIPSRMYTLGREKWIPLAMLLSVEHGSAEYTHKERAGMFYAESWALTHMLMLSNEYSKGLAPLMKALGAGTPPEEAFEKTFGMPLARLDKYVQAYAHGERFNSGTFDVQFAKTEQALEVTPVTSFDCEMMLADLLMGTGKREAAAAAYEKLGRQEPNRPEVPQVLGYMAWRGGDLQGAVKQFARASSLNSNSARLYRDYAALLALSNDRGEAYSNALERSVALEPDHVETRLRLAYAYVQAQKFDRAVHHFVKVKKVTPEQAKPFLEGLLYSCYRMGDVAGARAAAQRLRELASKPEEIASAERWQRMLDAPKAPQRVTPLREPAYMAEDARPHLRRGQPREEMPVTEEIAPDSEFRSLALQSATGQLQRLDCTRTPVRLTLLVDGKAMEFAIDNAQSVQLTGFGAGTMDLECGTLKPMRVLLRYILDEKANPPAKLVRSIEVQKNAAPQSR